MSNKNWAGNFLNILASKEIDETAQLPWRRQTYTAVIV